MIVRYSRRALNDLTKILDTLDGRSPRGARNVKLAIQGAIDTIGENPGLGHLVYWTVEANEVWLVPIRHGARRPWR